MKYILAIGNPFDGLELVGPFDDASAATDFAEGFSVDGEWNVVPVKDDVEFTKEHYLDAFPTPRTWGEDMKPEDLMGIPKEWSGAPDPLDPDNFWIDDETKERVNASTGERLPPRDDSEFSGYHKFRNHETGEEYGSFEVFHSDTHKEGTMELESGWYWWSCQPGCLPDTDGSEPANGPFPTAEGAYLDAIRD